MEKLMFFLKLNFFAFERSLWVMKNATEIFGAANEFVLLVDDVIYSTGLDN